MSLSTNQIIISTGEEARQEWGEFLLSIYIIQYSFYINIRYNENQYSLPRWEDLSVSRQTMYDNTYHFIPTQGWMFLPLVVYHGGNFNRHYIFTFHLLSLTPACTHGNTDKGQINLMSPMLLLLLLISYRDVHLSYKKSYTSSSVFEYLLNQLMLCFGLFRDCRWS